MTVLSTIFFVIKLDKNRILIRASSRAVSVANIIYVDKNKTDHNQLHAEIVKEINRIYYKTNIKVNNTYLTSYPCSIGQSSDTLYSLTIVKESIFIEIEKNSYMYALPIFRKDLYKAYCMSQEQNKWPRPFTLADGTIIKEICKGYVNDKK